MLLQLLRGDPRRKRGEGAGGIDEGNAIFECKGIESLLNEVLSPGPSGRASIHGLHAGGAIEGEDDVAASACVARGSRIWLIGAGKSQDEQREQEHPRGQ